MPPTKTLARENLQPKIIWTLVVILALLVGAYLYLVNKSVFNIVGRQQAEQSLNALNVEVAALETEYMALTASKINLDYAYSLGYQNVPNSLSYVAKSIKPVVISMHNNEI